MAAQEIHIPDIGDFHDVPVVEIYVSPGETVAADDPLVMLESDKATLDVPSPVAGTVVTLEIAVGDRVSHGTRIGTVEVAGAAQAAPSTFAASAASRGEPNHEAGRSRRSRPQGSDDRAGPGSSAA